MREQEQETYILEGEAMFRFKLAVTSCERERDLQTRLERVMIRFRLEVTLCESKRLTP